MIAAAVETVEKVEAELVVAETRAVVVVKDKVESKTPVVVVAQAPIVAAAVDVLQVQIAAAVTRVDVKMIVKNNL